jgi:hypothetical protein
VISLAYAQDQIFPSVRFSVFAAAAAATSLLPLSVVAFAPPPFSRRFAIAAAVFHTCLRAFTLRYVFAFTFCRLLPLLCFFYHG